MVKFCPKCGGPLIPKSSGENNLVLKCNRCGYELKADKNDVDRYRMKYQVEAGKRIQTSKAVEARKSSLSPEEREMLQEYYEIFLESFQEETSED
uniref:DNA-directed RNA polymerase subunit M n=1 Tax=Staphylothermus marinus TaxID=2280 RepID=A0A7C4D7P2_STAMA